jgi:tRNA(adenine34) deaminase
MCAGAIVRSRLATLVFGADDERAGAVVSLFDTVRDPRLLHTPNVVRGVLADASATLLRDFFAARRA